MLKLILFDVDGVIINSANDIFDAVNYTLNKLSLSKKTYEEVFPTMSAGTYGRFALWIKDEVTCQRAVEIYREYYINEVCKKTMLYPSVKETIIELCEKCKIGIVSNKLSSIIKEVLANNGILECFDIIIGSEMLSAPKPDPSGILQALEIIKVTANEALMVGDSDIDILAGKSAKVKTCGVTYGIGNLQDMKNTKPDYIIDDFSKILNVQSILSE